MKAKLNKSPIELLLVVVDRNETDKTIKVLSDLGVDYDIAFMSTGTAKSEIADLFSFGLIDREIIGCFIPKVQINIAMETISRELKFEEKNHGIAMAIPVGSASSNLLELLECKI